MHVRARGSCTHAVELCNRVRKSCRRVDRVQAQRALQVTEATQLALFAVMVEVLVLAVVVLIDVAIALVAIAVKLLRMTLDGAAAARVLIARTSQHHIAHSIATTSLDCVERTRRPRLPRSQGGAMSRQRPRGPARISPLTRPTRAFGHAELLKLDAQHDTSPVHTGSHNQSGFWNRMEVREFFKRAAMEGLQPLGVVGNPASLSGQKLLVWLKVWTIFFLFTFIPHGQQHRGLCACVCHSHTLTRCTITLRLYLPKCRLQTDL